MAAAALAQQGSVAASAVASPVVAAASPSAATTSPSGGRPTYTVAEAAHLLGLSEHALREGIRVGRVPVLRLGRRVLVRSTTVERLLAEGRVRPRKGAGRDDVLKRRPGSSIPWRSLACALFWSVWLRTRRSSRACCAWPKPSIVRGLNKKLEMTPFRQPPRSCVPCAVHRPVVRRRPALSSNVAHMTASSKRWPALFTSVALRSCTLQAQPGHPPQNSSPCPSRYRP